MANPDFCCLVWLFCKNINIVTTSSILTGCLIYLWLLFDQRARIVVYSYLRLYVGKKNHDESGLEYSNFTVAPLVLHLGRCGQNCLTPALKNYIWRTFRGPYLNHPIGEVWNTSTASPPPEFYILAMTLNCLWLLNSCLNGTSTLVGLFNQSFNSFFFQTIISF